MLIFFFLFFSSGGKRKGGWHSMMSLWLFEQSGTANAGKTQLNLPGLLLHLPVNEHCCWRYPCVPCHEASRQHLHLTLWPQRKMAAAVTDVLPVLRRKLSESYSQRAWTYHSQQLPQHVFTSSSSLWNKEAALSSKWHQTWENWSLNVTKKGVSS